MATLKAVVRKSRSDGFYPVYIRIVHRSRMGYIKTDKVVCSKQISSLPELGRDVAKLVLCLAGINTVDLFQMKKENYRNGIICYKRAKTKHSRADEAYIEMRVEPFIKPIFDKYLAAEDAPYLFNFHLRYCDSDSFSANVNNGIKKA